MDLLDLYKLSFTESFDTIEAMDHKNAELIIKFAASEKLRAEILATGVTSDTLGAMRRMTRLHDGGMDTSKLFTRKHWGTRDYEILSEANSGKSTIAISEMVNLSPETIRKKMRATGLRYSKKAHRWVNPICPISWTTDDFIKMVNEGMTCDKIGIHFGIRHEIVSKRLIEAGYKYNKSSKKWEKQL